MRKKYPWWSHVIAVAAWILVGLAIFFLLAPVIGFFIEWALGWWKEMYFNFGKL